MFKDLLDFSKERTIKEAIGFYFIYFFGGILLSVLLMLLCIIIVLILPISMIPEFFYSSELSVEENWNEGLEIGFQVGPYLALIVNSVLGFLILYKKNSLRLLEVCMFVLSEIVAFSLGALFSMIIIAWLTTRPNRS
jgi:hypothetical protein